MWGMLFSVCGSAFRVVFAAGVAAATAGCSLGPPPAGVSEDRAFISHHPVKEGDRRTRLAVKDSIDVRGEVTTAGSEFMAAHRPPAVRDADCLAIAR